MLQTENFAFTAKFNIL